HEAEQRIIQLQRKKRLNMASEEEISLLNNWEIYSIKLIDIDSSEINEFDWPKKPAE
ncbi:tail fiber assembly protein, partial [Xenorhabdus bovienii]|uniref:tail fiber assembly protein n=1 Tax=Xenorhabdus bovienii TaxID=40576 RepID=UPI0023B292A9